MANIKTGRKISLPIWKETAGIPIELRQGNINSIFLTVDFLGADALAVTLPPGAKPRMEWQKPDKTIVMQDGVVDPANANAFIVELTAQCFTAAGRAVADFKVADAAGNVLVGAQLAVEIGASAVNPTAITSVSEFVTLQNALSDVAYAAETSQQAIIRANAAMELIEPSTRAAAASERNSKTSEINAKASENVALDAKTKVLTAETNAAHSADVSIAAATRAEAAANSMHGVGVHRYGALWDGINATCTRMFNAVGMVANAHKGTFDPTLKNDFDSVYPWSGIKFCNWESGTATEKAKIIAFDGEPGFSLAGNLGVYRPEFWYKSEPQASGGSLFVIADGKLPGYTYNPSYMITPFCTMMDAGGVCCKIGGTPAYSISLNTYNAKHAAQGMLSEDYWCDGAEKLLMIIEFATMNSQSATGNGLVSARYSDDRPAFAETAANRVILLKANAEQYAAGTTTIGIGTTWFGNFKAYYRRITSITPYTDPLYSCVNFDGAPVDVATTDHVGTMSAYFDGLPVKTGSGYVGVNGRAVSWYRGAALQTGALMWIANIMRNTDEKLWVAPRDTPQTGSIGTDWIDSGITLPSTEGYIKGMSISNKCPLLMQPCDVGGNTANPVGDYLYRPAVGTAPTALLSRGRLGYSLISGACCGYWRIAPSVSDWLFAVRSLIRCPFGGLGVETPVKPD